MRVLQVTPYFLPHRGGIESYVFRLSRDLVLDGHEVTIYTSQIPHDTKSHEWNNGFEVHRFKAYATPLGNPIVPTLFLKILENANQYDLIHCHDEHGFTSNVVLFYKKLGLIKIPVILNSHGLSPFTDGLSYFMGKIYDLIIGAMNFRDASAIVALSSYDKEYIMHYSKVPPEKVRVIPNAIDTETYDLVLDSTPFVKKFGLEGKRIVLYVGSLIKRKGVQYIISSAPKIIQEMDNIRFVIVGSGRFKSTLEDLVKENSLDSYFIFTGRVSNEELYMAYKSCDLVVLPSIIEGVPTVVYEACLYVKPVIVTDTPGAREYFNGNVVLVPPRNVERLSHAILRILKDKEYALSLASKGRDILTKLNWRGTFQETCSLYKTVLTHAEK